MTVLVEKQLDLLVGGLQSQVEISQHLLAYWKGFQLFHGDHEVFREHSCNLQSVIPLSWHGDEGRGKRRGNTCVVSLEAPIGIETVLRLAKKRRRGGCGQRCNCNPPAWMKQKYNRVEKKLDDRMLSALDAQWTNQKHHSFMQHWCLFVLPSWLHHEHPDALPELLEVMAKDMKRLFYEGVSVATPHGNRHFSFAITAAKGDLKWFCKIALERNFQNQGRIHDYGCCHECQAGNPGLPWECMAEQPVWSQSRYTQRPWSQPHPTMAVPFCRDAPEKMFKRDMFHCGKLGPYRDHVGSSIIWLCEKGYFGQGDLPSKLEACHGLFKLYCSTTGKTASLRSFSRAFFMYPRRSAYPWVNAKGSDVTLLMKFLAVQLTGFLNAPLDPGHRDQLALMQQVCLAATGFSKMLTEHGHFAGRDCSMIGLLHLRRFIIGYTNLANMMLNETWAGWAIKPKLHLLKHAELEIHEWLHAGMEILPNFNCHGCEQNEDYIGRVCRLSRRLDSRRIGERLLKCCLIKSRVLYKRFLKQNNLPGLGWGREKKHSQ